MGKSSSHPSEVKGYHNEQQRFKISMHFQFTSPNSNPQYRMVLKLYLVLFQLTWPEWGINVSIQATYLQKAHSALQYNTPDLQAPASYLGPPPWLLRAPWMSRFTQSCATSAVTAKGSASFCFTCTFKDQDQDFKGLQELWGQITPRRFNSAKRKVSLRVKVLANSNKTKTVKATGRR